MLDVKLFLKRSTIAAVTLALIVPGLAVFSLAEGEEQPAETQPPVLVTNSDGSISEVTYEPITTTVTAENPGRYGFTVSGTDETTPVTGSDGPFQTQAGLADGEGNPPSNPITFSAFTFGQSYSIYSENNNDTTTSVDAMITKTDQADGSQLITYTLTNNTSAAKDLYIGSNAYLKVGGDTGNETFSGGAYRIFHDGI